MHFLSQIFFILIAAFIIWQLFHYVRANPQMFTKETLGRSFFTMGILALLLIGFVALCVVIVRAT